MAATGLQLNWSAVSFAGTTFTRVTSVMFTQGGTVIDFSGDNARYPQVVANNMNRPRCTINSGDVAALMGIAPGATGTISATQADALAAASGGIVWTMVTSVHENSDNTGQFSQFAGATASFMAYAADGITNPLSFTRV